jgi:hypothetical protein
MTLTLSTSQEGKFQHKLEASVRKFWNPLTLKDLKEIKSLLNLKFPSDFIIEDLTIEDTIREYMPIFHCKQHPVALAFWLLCERNSEKSVNSARKQMYDPTGDDIVKITNIPFIFNRIIASTSVQVAMLMLAGANLDLLYTPSYTYNSNNPPKKTFKTHTVRRLIEERIKNDNDDPCCIFRMKLALYLSSKQKTQAALKKDALNSKLTLVERMASYEALAHSYKDLWLGTLDINNKKSPMRKGDGLREYFVNKEKQLTKDGVILNVFLLLLAFQAYEGAMNALNKHQQRGIETKVYKADLEYRMRELCNQLPKTNNEHKLVDFWNLLIPKHMKHQEDRKQSYSSKIADSIYSIYSTLSKIKGKEKTNNQLQYQVLHAKEEDRTTKNRI